ncbi:FAD-binding protein [Candidatus Roizmanbacteria bacterium]|nr:FAD-binding protein [Candidatus Roizmanbacteria bacterium]
MKIVNFGANVSFDPKHFYEPRSEEEVLDILNKHKDGKIRVVGSLHAWSDCVVSEDVIVDLRYINSVEVTKDKNNGQVWATVGGGCVLQDMLDAIRRKAGSNVAIPTLGGLKRQTIAGAISTGTHGSGKSSLSHFMKELRMAAYDPKTGKAKIYNYKEGSELQAARCSLGCMGIIVSVKFRLVPQYWIREKLERYKNLQDLMAKRKDYPLQQFTLFPYLWEYFSFQRQVTSQKPSAMAGFAYFLARWYDYFSVEILSHIMLSFLIRLFPSEKGSSKTIQWFYKRFIPRFISQPSVVNESTTGLTLHTAHHYYFRHLEMEIFILPNDLAKAVKVIRAITSVFAEEQNEIPEEVTSELKRIGAYDELISFKGIYTHHYPFFFRYVEPDDTLISMTSDGNARYSISFFTYLSHEKNKYFYKFADFSARTLMKLYGARLHWGKYFPLINKEIENLYPQLEKFRFICNKVDPKGVFRNDYTRRTLGLKIQ